MDEAVELASIGSFFLTRVNGKEPSDSQITTFLEVAKRGTVNHLAEGDIILPLKSPLLKKLANSDSIFSHFITDPTQKNLEVLDSALSSGDDIIMHIWMSNDVLRLSLNKGRLIEKALKEVALAGMKYGASNLLEKVEVEFANKDLDEDLLHTFRKKALIRLMLNVIANNGGKMKLLQERKTENESKSNPKAFEEMSSSEKSFNLEDLTDEVETENAGQPSGTPNASQPLQTLGGKQSVKVFSSNEEENRFSVGKVQPQDQEKEYTDFVKREEQFQEDTGILNDKNAMGSGSITGSNAHEDCLPQSIDDTKVGNQNRGIDGTRVEMHDEMPVSSNIKYEVTQKSKKKCHSISVDSSIIRLLITDDSPGRKNISRTMQCLPVVKRRSGKPWNGSEEDYCKILVKELRRSAEMKHGDVSSPEWMKLIEEQAWQCMTLQMLSVSHSNLVKIEVESHTNNTKESAFVLYNYARVSTIFKKFEEHVARKDFSSLPLADDVDFSLLNQEEEWVIVWIYILRWPEIVREMALPLLDESKKLRTATIARFLLSLSHQFSEYYSRYHVLVSEPLTHMVPLMYARLYLLKAILTIMEICFNLLGVDSPPAFM